MGYPVTYHCPQCGAVVELEREGYLADKAVTPYPLEGWTYVTPSDGLEDADGVRFVCGEDDAVAWYPPGRNPQLSPQESAQTPPETRSDGNDHDGCGERFYLSFVRFRDGEEVEPRSPTERVELADGAPSTPRGPQGPSGPGGFYREK